VNGISRTAYATREQAEGRLRGIVGGTHHAAMPCRTCLSTCCSVPRHARAEYHLTPRSRRMFRCCSRITPRCLGVVARIGDMVRQRRQRQLPLLPTLSALHPLCALLACAYDAAHILRRYVRRIALRHTFTVASLYLLDLRAARAYILTGTACRASFARFVAGAR